MEHRGSWTDAGPRPVFIQTARSTSLRGAGTSTIEDRELFKAGKGTRQTIDKLAAIRLTAVFPTIAMAARVQRDGIFSVSIGNN